MLKNNWLFQEHIIYDFDEVMKFFNSYDENSTIDDTTLKDILKGLKRCYVVNYSIRSNPSGLSFLHLTDNVYDYGENVLEFLNKLYQRYKNHYCIDILHESEKEKAFNDLMNKVVNLLDYTYPKYSNLIDLYSSQKSHLMDKLSRVRQGQRDTEQDGESSSQGTYKDLHNDTPQSTDVVATLEQDQFVSDLSKGNNSNEGETHQIGSDTFNETETHDPTTIIERLNEIEKKFSQVWRRWLDEFEQLFIDVVNY